MCKKERHKFRGENFSELNTPKAKRPEPPSAPLSSKILVPLSCRARSCRARRSAARRSAPPRAPRTARGGPAPHASRFRASPLRAPRSCRTRRFGAPPPRPPRSCRARRSSAAAPRREREELPCRRRAQPKKLWIDPDNGHLQQRRPAGRPPALDCRRAAGTLLYQALGKSRRVLAVLNSVDLLP
jgi:hypothetical protein